jgi:AcrR family transcriptional regulator
VLGTPTGGRIAERREATRLEILAAAWEVAREDGVAQLTLRSVAERVGMRAPSLYSHFGSKHEIYDAMFGQGWAEYLRLCQEMLPELPKEPRARLLRIAGQFFDHSVADPAWYQLLNQRVVPGFEPSAASYAPSLAVMELLREQMRDIGVADDGAVDLWVAVVGGLVEGQLANDPGGDRYRRLLERAVDMFADHVGVPRVRTDRSDERRG